MIPFFSGRTGETDQELDGDVHRESIETHRQNINVIEKLKFVHEILFDKACFKCPLWVYLLSVELWSCDLNKTFTDGC